SGGAIEAVTDAEILEAYRMLAATEGVFCEPASAASVAGLRKLWSSAYCREVPERERLAVCTLTGHGLKDPSTALRAIEEPPALEPELKAVLAAVGLGPGPLLP